MSWIQLTQPGTKNLAGLIWGGTACHFLSILYVGGNILIAQNAAEKYYQLATILSFIQTDIFSLKVLILKKKCVYFPLYWKGHTSRQKTKLSLLQYDNIIW